MSSFYSCPQGHYFRRQEAEAVLEPGTEPALGRAAGVLLCPVCGQSGERAGSDAERTARISRLQRDEPPPWRPEQRTSAAPPLPPPGSVPGYELLEEIGRGGMGVVYKARQVDLHRLVAVKVLLGGPFVDAASVARFRHEAEAVAALQHPNIVQVYEIGVWQPSEAGAPMPFFSMEYVGGGNLARRLDGAPVAPTEAARLIETLARAVHHAHEHGIVHRDLKPANVLLQKGQQGQQGPEDFGPFSVPDVPFGLLPKITDFGIAKHLDGVGPLTMTGVVMGTPEYMAPEQAHGHGHVGPACDIYALGVMLYELLTGRPPFQGVTAWETIEQAAVQEPGPPSRLGRRVSRDLETICLKCLRKEPQRRYGSARDLAEDLRRYLTDEPIKARPVGRAERVLKWARRYPGWAALAGVLLLVVLVGFPTLVTLWLSAEQARGMATARAMAEAHALAEARQQRQRAEDQRREAERRELLLAIDRGLGLCEQGEIGRGLLWLVRSLEMADKEDIGDPELRQALRVNLAEWETQLPRAQRELRHLGTLRTVAFHPSGKTVLGGGDLGALPWDVTSGEPSGPALATSVPLVLRTVWSVTCSPDGKYVATGHSDGTARLWNAADGTERAVLRGDGPDVWQAAFSSDGKLLATCAGTVARLWELPAGKPVGVPLQHPEKVLAVAFSPDGQRLLTGGWDSKARMWRIADGTLVASWPVLRHDDRVMDVAFSPDGGAVLTCCRDGTVRLWDAANGQLLGPPLRHFGEATSAVFSPDGRTILTTGHDETARLWDRYSLQPLGSPLVQAGDLKSAAFSPDGRTAVVGGLSKSARLWQLPRDRRVGGPLEHSAPIHVARFRPDSDGMFTSTQNYAVLWDSSGERLADTRTGTRLHATAYAPARQLAATSDWHGAVKRWDVSGRKRGHLEPLGQPFQVAGSVNRLVFNPEGEQLFGVRLNSPRQVRAWDVASGQLLKVAFSHPDSVTQVALAADGTMLATGCRDLAVRLWIADTGEQFGEALLPESVVQALAFRPDGKVLAAGCRDGTVRLWDVPTGQPIASRTRPMQHRGEILALVFSPDGQRLLTGGADRVGRVWDVATGVQLGGALGHQGAVQAVAFNPEGSLLLTGGRDRVVQRWQAPGGPAEGTLEAIRTRLEKLTGLTLDSAGNFHRPE